MKVFKYLLLAGLLLSVNIVLATGGKYIYKLDLTNVVDDKVYVELTVPEFEGDKIIFHMPKMIPGTYAIEDYGRFVSEFKAMDKRGRKLPVEKTGINSWQISKAHKLVTISYWIEDSYDTDLNGPEIFQPAGTNIEEGINFVINASGFFGYFENMTNVDYEINIIKPTGFYGSTGLIAESIDNQLSPSFTLESKKNIGDELVDVFVTSNYDELVDSPFMYNLPDTTLLTVGGAQILVSSYSPNNIVSSKEIAKTLEEVLMVQKDYLGGELPVDKYAFIFYFTDEPILSYGALEHSYSSFYYMPEDSIGSMNQQLRDFAAHEFFHIVTPLSIHSEEIKPFDFSNPKMSKHLWLYEGMTEYFASNAQVQGGLINADQYINVLRNKMYFASEFIDTLAFTELSLGALDTYEDQYMNVYQKGALIGLGLDLTLLELSDGEYGVQEMMADLAKEYGKDKSFMDEALFDKITALTFPQVRGFFSLYVEGTNPLPMAELMLKAGMVFELEGDFYDYSLGLNNSTIGVDVEKGVLYVQNEQDLDEFGKQLGLQDGDIIKAMNGAPFPELGPQVIRFLESVVNAMVEGEDFSITVVRQGEDKSEEEVVLTAEIIKVKTIVPFAIRPLEEATEKQLRVRKAWLGVE